MLDLDAIKARLSAALSGPWTGMTIHRSLDGDCLAIVRQQENGGATIAATVVPTYSDRDTIPLFLHARADMDALVAEVDRLRAENRKLRDVLAWSEAQCPGKCAGVCGDALTYAAKGDK